MSRAIDLLIPAAWLLPHAILLGIGAWEYRRDSRGGEHRFFHGFWLVYLGVPAALAAVIIALFRYPSWPGRIALGLSAAWAWLFLRMHVNAGRSA